jgi:L-asparaginase II
MSSSTKPYFISLGEVSSLLAKLAAGTTRPTRAQILQQAASAVMTQSSGTAGAGLTFLR